MIKYISLICFAVALQVQAQTCPLDIKINGSSPYAVPLTESGSWIKASITMDSNTAVVLDADPVNGYVELTPGFIATPSSSYFFLARTLYGCGGIHPSQRKYIQEAGAKSMLYPNPAYDKFYIHIDEPVKDVAITVFDTSGKLIYNNSANMESKEDLAIDISEFAEGIYIVNVIGDSATYSFPFIKRIN